MPVPHMITVTSLSSLTLGHPFSNKAFELLAPRLTALHYKTGNGDRLQPSSSCKSSPPQIR
jgi:hypothetical protein